MTAAEIVIFEPERLPPVFSDDHLALEFAELHAEDLRYIGTMGKWMVWNGHRWQPDETRKVIDLVRVVCREAASKCNEPWAAKKMASKQTVEAVASLASSDRRLVSVAGQWDANAWLLNTPAGVVDLTSAKLLPHDAQYFATKLTAVTPAGDCPLWKAFLFRVFGEDAELIAFVQRVAGYALTGATSEHALFFGYGTGGNGKGVFLNTIAAILGDYHKAAPIETFTAASAEQHPTALAALRGARLVTSNETEEGRRWAEAKIKQLTGGDTIAARFMRQDFFEFTPQFKLFVTGNHKPGVRSVDEALRRRFNLIPFTVTIPPSERDPDLRDKLKLEWPGILAWAVEGCIAWQQGGLAPPKAVREATDAYLAAEDAIAVWIDERCIVDPDAWEGSGRLYASWKSWAETAGEYAGSQKRFAQNLDTHGFPDERRAAGRGFIGLRLT